GVFFSVRGPKAVPDPSAKSVGTSASIRPEAAKPAINAEIASPKPPPPARKPDLLAANRATTPKEIKKEIKPVELPVPPIHLERGSLLNNLQPHELSQARETLAEIERKTAQAEAARADDSAWSVADGKTRAPIEEYLRQFPSGRHREEA